MITGAPLPGGEQRVQGVIVRARRRSGGHNEPFGGVQHSGAWPGKSGDPEDGGKATDRQEKTPTQNMRIGSHR
jgi:hypothetical protein